MDTILLQVSKEKITKTGEQAHDEGVHRGPERLDYAMFDGVLDIAVPRCWDGTETSLVGKHSALETHYHDRFEGSSSDRLNTEGIEEDHLDDMHDAVDVEDNDNCAKDEPQERHEGHDLSRELGNPFDSAEDDNGDNNDNDCAED